MKRYNYFKSFHPKIPIFILVLIVLYLVFSTTKSNAQLPTLEWTATYNGFIDSNALDLVSDMIVDREGNVFVTGSSMASFDNFDILTVKYNSSGIQQWVRRYEGPNHGYDRGTAITVDTIGNVYVVGYSQDIGNNEDYVTIKYNSIGDTIWIQRWNGTGNHVDFAYDVAVDDIGNVYVTGSMMAPNCIGCDATEYATIKYNSSGVLLWVQIYHESPGPFGDEGRLIKLDNEGNVIVSGSLSFPGNSTNYGTIKYNTDGVFQWRQIYTGLLANREDIVTSMEIDAMGNIYVTGYSLATNLWEDFVTIKYSPSGDELWVQRYNGTGNALDKPWDMVLDNENNVYVVGESWGGAGFSSVDYALVKYNSDGIQQWVRRYNGVRNNRDYAFSIATDLSKNVYITGQSIEIPLIGSHATTIKYDPLGELKWIIGYSNGSGDKGLSINVAENFDVYIAGNSWGSNNEDYLTLKYSQLSGLNTIGNEIPKIFKLQQNYPNPFNPNTKIKFSIPKAGFIQIKVYDVLGRIQEIPVKENLKPSEYELTFDASKYSSGVYFYQLSADGIIFDTKKMVILR